MKKYVGLLIAFVLAFGLTMQPKPSEATIVHHTLYNVGGSVTVGNSTSSQVFYTAIPLVPNGNNVVTYIKYRIKFNNPENNNIGTNYPSSCSSILCGGYPGYRNEIYSNGLDSISLDHMTNVGNYNVSNSNTWNYFEKSFVNAEASGNRYLRFSYCFNGNAHFSYTIEVLEVHYDEYAWNDVHLEITPGKFVKIVAQIDEPTGFIKCSLYNTLTKRCLDLTTSDKKTFTCIDNSVLTDQHYLYNFYSDIGIYGKKATDSFGVPYYFQPLKKTLSVYVPTDTYDKAAEAATNALNAKNSADATKILAQTAVSQTLYNGQSAAYWAYMATSEDKTGPELNATWLNGATITNSSHQAKLLVNAMDSVSSTENISLAYSINGGNYVSFTGSTPTLTLPTSPKYATVFVKATDQAGNQTVKTLNIFVR